jgi:hypothetical protein
MGDKPLRPHNPKCLHTEIKPTIHAMTSVLAITFSLYGFECVSCDRSWDVGDAAEALRKVDELARLEATK